MGDLSRREIKPGKAIIGLFSGIDLIYERTTVCECGLNVGFLEHGCTLSGPTLHGARK